MSPTAVSYWLEKPAACAAWQHLTVLRAVGAACLTVLAASLTVFAGLLACPLHHGSGAILLTTDGSKVRSRSTRGERSVI